MCIVKAYPNLLCINEIPPPEKSGRGICIPLLCKIAHYFADMLMQSYKFIPKRTKKRARFFSLQFCILHSAFCILHFEF